MAKAGTILTLAFTLLSLIVFVTPATGLVTPLGTTSPPTWSKMPPISDFPQARSNLSLAATGGSTGGVLLFGGLGCGGYCNDTWLFGTGSGYLEWGERYAQGPSGREGAAMVGDAVAGKAILFGGRNGSSYFSDSWTFNGTSEYWHLLTPSASPMPSAFASAVWNSNRDSMLLFGGEGPSDVALGSTWMFSNGGWTDIQASPSPSPRWGASMVFDPNDGSTYLFGGTNGSAVFSDLWAYNAGNWSELRPSVSPRPRSFASMTETADGSLLLFGGQGATRLLNDTWTFPSGGGSWKNLTPLFNSGAPSPSPLEGAELVPDPAIAPNVFLLAGGYPNDTSSMDTWMLSVPSGGASGGLVVDIHLKSTSGTSPFTEVLTAQSTGGTPPYNFTWDPGDGSSLVYGVQVTHVFKSTFNRTYFVKLAVTDSVGDRSVAFTSIVVSAPPVPPPVPPPPPWIIYGIAGVIVALGGLGTLAYGRDVVRTRRRRTALFSALGQRECIPYPFSLGVLLKKLSLDHDLVSCLWAAFRETKYWFGRRAFSKVSRFTVWLTRSILNIAAKLLFVVTVVWLLFAILQLQNNPGVTFRTDYWLNSWWTAILYFISGKWFVAVTCEPGFCVPFYLIALSTFELAAVSLALSVVIAYPLGMLSGWFHGGKVDTATSAYSALGLYLPTMILSIFLIGGTYMLWVRASGGDLSSFGILPNTAQWYDDHMGGVPSWITLAGTTSPTGLALVDVALHGAWPLEAIVLAKTLFQGSIIALLYSSIYIRYLRYYTSDLSEQPFILAGRARGVSERALLWRHAARDALSSYISVFSTTFGLFILTVSIVEMEFVDPGIGAFIWNPSYYLDALVTVVYMLAIAVVLTNTIADGLVRVLDKRFAAGRLV